MPRRLLPPPFAATPLPGGVVDPHLLGSPLVIIPAILLAAGLAMLAVRRRVRPAWSALARRLRLPDSSLLADAVVLVWHLQAIALVAMGVPALIFNLWLLAGFTDAVGAATEVR